jgi:hypothetical protein
MIERREKIKISKKLHAAFVNLFSVYLLPAGHEETGDNAGAVSQKNQATLAD